MKLETRLAAASLTIIIVPMMLLYLMAVVFSSYQAKSFIKEYDLSEPMDFFPGNSMQIPNWPTRRSQEDIRKTLDKSPGLYSNKEYPDTINAELKNHYAHLVMTREDAIIHCGDNNIMEDEALYAQPSHFGATRSEADGGIYLDGGTYLDRESQHPIKRMDFDFLDVEVGNASIISNVDDLVPEVKSMLREVLILGAMILVITGIALTLWVYYSILSPLNKLQEATKKIRDGNLEFALEVDVDGKIGQLCRDFEEMRIRLRESTDEKVQYDKDNKELISNVSYDLKTPIMAIKKYVEGIMDGVASLPERLDKYIWTIYNKANDMDRSIDELIFYSKIDINKIPYTFSKINVAQCFKSCVDEVGLDMEARGIELGCSNHVDEDMVVIVDMEQMKRVISNIISNSVKYLDKKRGIINIRIKDMEDFMQVEIEDNGKRIVAKDIPNISDRFYRTDSSRNSSQGGSGIGLSIVRKIIEDYGGRIWATSKEGTGTEIHFALRKHQGAIQDEQDTDRGR